MGAGRMTQRRPLLLAALAAAAAGSASAQAEWRPERPVRLLLGFPPGGSADALARRLAEPLGRLLGQPVVVENRPGAGGNIAMEALAKAPPDGHTVGLGPIGPHAINPALLGAKMPYDAARDFAPVLRLVDQPNVLLAASELPAEPAALLAWLRANPEEPYGSPGVGTSNHFTGALLSRALGLRLQHVPYRGGAAGLADLIGGRIRLYVDNLAGALALLREGRFRAVAVSTAARSRSAPDVPAFAEIGVGGVEVSSWQGLFAPAALPGPALRRWNAAANEVLRDPVVAGWLAENAAEPAGGTAEAFGAFLAAERARWAAAVRDTGITLD
jgi:tripartite-type tricarboxylate transporter receptor subunit TctC